jgi:two-component system NtrC family response regulator
MKPLLLLVDDDEALRTQMRWALDGSYDVLLAEDRRTAVEMFRTWHPPVALLDLGLPPSPAEPTEGLATLTDLLALDRRAKVIIVSGQADKQNALNAIGQGAYDFLCKPVEMDELRLLLKRCFHVAQLEHEYGEMQERLGTNDFEGMLGNCPAMREVFGTIRKVAPSDAPVLVLGDSGTGKELAGHAIHRLSLRKDGPFVPINCAAIPENLLESELFGHEKGAFTGAHLQRQGRLEMAAHGTLFLDEISELPAALQVKLLRFLQEFTIERVGGRKSLPVDTRVIAATNADLKQALASGKFREDLYYRLAVVQIKLPLLRDRGGDIDLLARLFVRRYAANAGRGTLALDHQAVRALRDHAWPGNVRELENRIKRAVIMAEGQRITAADLELTSATGQSLGEGVALREARETVERELVTRALQRHGGKIAPAAVELGISRPTFYELMAKLGIKKE